MVADYLSKLWENPVQIFTVLNLVYFLIGFIGLLLFLKILSMARKANEKEKQKEMDTQRT